MLVFISFVIAGALLGLIWGQVFQMNIKAPRNGIWSFPAMIGAVAGFVMWIVWRIH